MIQEVEICNFKSFFLDKVSVFSREVNLIVGLNGQGKSNFYGAIRFCIKSEESDTIPEEIKRGLLNVT